MEEDEFEQLEKAMFKNPDGDDIKERNKER